METKTATATKPTEPAIQFQPGNRVTWNDPQTTQTLYGTIETTGKKWMQILQDGGSQIVSILTSELSFVPIKSKEAAQEICTQCFHYNETCNSCLLLVLDFNEETFMTDCCHYQEPITPKADGLSNLTKAVIAQQSQSAPSNPPSDRPIIFLQISEIEADAGTQQRVKTDLTHVLTLAEVIEDGISELEPIVVFQDESDRYILVDGFHRLSAYRSLDRDVIPCYILKGTLREAILYSCKANAEHLALPRNRADKRKSVETLLLDPEWVKWSDREIAEACQVSHPTVAAIRRSLAVPQSETRTCERNGTVYEQKVKPIKVIDESYEGTDYNEPQDEPDRQITFVTSPPATEKIPVNVQEVFLAFKSNLPDLPPLYCQAAFSAIAQRLINGSTGLPAEDKERYLEFYEVFTPNVDDLIRFAQSTEYPLKP